LRFADLGSDDNFTFSLGILTVGNTAVDFSDDGIILGFARFEQLCDAWKTTGDVLGFSCLTRYFGNDIARANDCIVLNRNIGSYRKKISTNSTTSFTAGVLDGN